MIESLLKFFLSLVILLHCVGVTQLASAVTKDKSAFVGMLNMNEEETKKEKESKEDVDDVKDILQKPYLSQAHLLLTGKHIYYSDSKNRISHQFIIESPTPPPDFNS